MPGSAASPPVTSSAASAAPDAATATAQANKTVIPPGYQTVLVNGEKHYCRTEVYTGSRVKKDKVCLSQEQLEAEQASARDLKQRLQSGGALTMPCATGGGGGAVGC
jgi:hypothetical protein